MNNSKSRDRKFGMMFGLVVGDALGTTLEFDERRPLDQLHTEIIGEGPFDLKPGEWTDDTSMALAMAASLIACGGFNGLHIMQEFCTWYKMGRHSVNGKCFDIGNSTRSALDAYLNRPTRLPLIDQKALGNGGLMRLAPVVIIAKDVNEAAMLGRRQSNLTHGMLAGECAALMADLMYQGTLEEVRILNTLEQRERVRASGFYKDTFNAALWAIATTSTFEDAVIQAVNLGDDADTVGAVTGQIAGAIYGYEAIPSRWLNTIVMRTEIEAIVEKLLVINDGCSA